MKRKICVVTGSRADYGLLQRLMRAIQSDRALQLQVIATGAHMSAKHGLTYKAIEADGFKISVKLPILNFGDSPVGITRSLGKAVDGLAVALNKLKPDLLVLLGDRYEMLAAAQAAMLARIPIAHIHGGESSEGAIDEAIRHAITKMSHFHFVTTPKYRRRVIQLGEHPSRVFCFGAPGLDNIRLMRFMTPGELEKQLGVNLRRSPVLLVTYHPVTLDKKGPEKALKALFEALDRFKNASVIMTKSNADAEGERINRLIDAYAAKRRGKVKAFVSLGQKRYLSLMKAADAVVGNSSSGILEAPSLKVPSVDLGDRQRGRLKDPSVISCAENRDAIMRGIQKALSPKFKRSLKNQRSVYGRGGTVALKIKEKLKKLPLEGVLMKKFYE